VRASIPIDDIITQQRFGPEAQALEYLQRASLFGSHASDDFLETKLSCNRKQLVRQQVSEAYAAVVRADEQHDFAQMPRPLKRVMIECSVADQLAVCFSEYSANLTALDVLNPLIESLLPGDVYAKKSRSSSEET